MKQLGFDEEVFVYTGQNRGESTKVEGTNAIDVFFERPDAPFTVLHELGHLIHGDVDPLRSGSSYLEHPDPKFLSDVVLVDQYREIGADVIDHSTKLGRQIKSILGGKVSFLYSNPRLYLDSLRAHGREKRADLFALQKAYEFKLIEPILQTLKDYVESKDIVTSRSHPNNYERALYIIGFLQEKTKNVNRLIKDFELGALDQKVTIFDDIGDTGALKVVPSESEVESLSQKLLGYSEPTIHSKQSSDAEKNLNVLRGLSWDLSCLIPGQCHSNVPFHKRFKEALEKLAALGFVKSPLEEVVAMHEEQLNMAWLQPIRLKVERQLLQSQWEIEKVTQPELQIFSVFEHNVWNAFLSSPRLKRVDPVTGVLDYNLLLELVHEQRGPENIHLEFVQEFDLSQEERLLAAMTPILRNHRYDPAIAKWFGDLTQNAQLLLLEKNQLTSQESVFLVRCYNILGSSFGVPVDVKFPVKYVSEIQSEVLFGIGYEAWRIEKLEDWKSRNVLSNSEKVLEMEYSIKTLSSIVNESFNDIKRFHDLLLKELSGNL